MSQVPECQQSTQALHDFTARYLTLWQQQYQSLPVSREHYGIPSPCIVQTVDDDIYWTPQPLPHPATLSPVERAVELILQPSIHAFYTTQYAADMRARYRDQVITLLQVWSDDDFVRLQENLIGHLVTQRRLKLSPTLFLATTESEMTLVSLCNLSGEVILEEFGTAKRKVLAPSLSHFLDELLPSL